MTTRCPLQKTTASIISLAAAWSEMGDSNSRHLAPKASALPTALIPAIQRSIKNLAAHYFYSTEIWWKVKRKLPEMILMMKIMNAAKVNADTTIAKPSSM